MQLLNLKNKIGTLIKINKDLDKSKLILLKLQDDFIVKMQNLGLNPGIFALDIYLYLLTVFTHEGDIKGAENQIILCEEAVGKLANRWESIDYFFMVKTRLAVHKINCFDFLNAYQVMTDIINVLKETMGLFSLIDGLDKLYDNLKSDILGKALGTRLQASTMMLRKEKELYKIAVEDSETALKEFWRSGDRNRQYQYRSQIEYEAGNYILALQNLFKVSKIKYDGSNSIAQFLLEISIAQSSIKSFCIMHYIKILAEAAIAREMDLADLLYNSLLKQKDLYIRIIQEDKMDHPYEIIVWKLATYQGLNGNLAAAINLYDQAIGTCFSRPERWTFLAIGLGILAEKSSILFTHSDKDIKEANKVFREFSNRYDDFLKLDLPESMRAFFFWWDEEIMKIKKSDDIQFKQNALWKLSREITY